MTNEEYGRLVARMAKPSPMGKDLLFAFLIGGGICAVGQLIQTGWQALGLDRESAGTATTMTLIFLSALFTALDCYNSLAKYAGAGTLVPVTAVPTPLSLRPLSLKARDWSARAVWRPKCLPLPDRSSCLAWGPA